jgi:hypothetical protein
MQSTVDCTRNRNRVNQISGSSKYEVEMDRRWSRLEFVDSLVFKSVGLRISAAKLLKLNTV